MIGERTERALARIETALARIESASAGAQANAAAAGAALAEHERRHERLRTAVGETLRDLDLLIAEQQG